MTTAASEPTPANAFKFALLDESIREIRDHGRECILCGRLARNAAVFVPKPSFNLELGAPQGKQRVVVYALCRRCIRRRGVKAQVEQMIREKVGQRLTREPGRHYPASNGRFL